MSRSPTRLPSGAGVTAASAAAASGTMEVRRACLAACRGVVAALLAADRPACAGAATPGRRGFGGLLPAAPAGSGAQPLLKGSMADVGVRPAAKARDILCRELCTRSAQAQIVKSRFTIRSKALRNAPENPAQQRQRGQHYHTPPPRLASCACTVSHPPVKRSHINSSRRLMIGMTNTARRPDFKHRHMKVAEGGVAVKQLGGVPWGERLHVVHVAAVAQASLVGHEGRR